MILMERRGTDKAVSAMKDDSCAIGRWKAMVAVVLMHFANAFLPSRCSVHEFWLCGSLGRSIIKGTTEPIFLIGEQEVSLN